MDSIKTMKNDQLNLLDVTKDYWFSFFYSEGDVVLFYSGDVEAYTDVKLTQGWNVIVNEGDQKIISKTVSGNAKCIVEQKE